MGELYPLQPKPDPSREPSAGKTVDAEALIRRTFDVDARAGMEMLFRQYYGVLCSHAVRYVSSRAIAEDIVSDILFEFQAKELFRHVSASYRAYLFTSVRNRAYDYVKKEMNHGNTVIDNALTVAGAASESPESITQFEELHRLIESTINAMPLRRKEVYLMHRFENKKSREIAGELQLSTRTVETHLYKALQQVHAALREHWLWMAIILLNAQMS